MTMVIMAISTIMTTTRVLECDSDGGDEGVVCDLVVMEVMTMMMMEVAVMTVIMRYN